MKDHVVGRIEFGPAAPRTYTMGVGDCAVDVVRRSEYDALAARLAEAERLLASHLWWIDGDCKADINDDTWKFLGFPPDPRLSVNGDERHG